MSYSKLPRLRVHLFGYIFSPGWVPTLVTLLIMPLLIGLGCWQLDRAKQKRLIENDFASYHKTLSVEQISNPNDPNLGFRPLQVAGYFDNRHTILIDNKTYKHIPGVYVITPLVIPQSKTRLLVNRGFMAMNNRSQLPKLAKVSGRQIVTGFIQFPSKAFLLKKEQLEQRWPLLIQSINSSELVKVLQYPIYPFLLMQKNEDGSLYIRDWHPVNFPSYRHKGYAIQWFLLALTLLIIYIKLNTSRKD